MKNELAIPEITLPPTYSVNVRRGLETSEISRKEREILNDLSKVAFGTTSKWQKVLSRTSGATVDFVVDYMQKKILVDALPEDVTKPLGTMSQTCFKNREAWKYIYYRDPRPVDNAIDAFKDLTNGMVKMCEIHVFSGMEDSDRVFAVSEFFKGNEDLSRIPFVLLASDAETIKAQLDLLPADMKDKVSPYVVSEFKENEVIAIDADAVMSQLLKEPEAND